ncbi:MAG: hypothetical protein HYW24_04795 [Candidatus Aenigmarchaeota archaeon]|nr:hypothetical protein [Candidatus Aenigmarchaeota archaeon]
MAESGHGHHLKLILALVLILGILGLIAYTNVNGNIDSLKIGSFVGPKKASASALEIVLTTDKTVLYGRTFSLTNSNVNLNGICSIITVSGLTIEGENSRCSVDMGGFSGKFDYSPFGSIVVTGSVSTITVNGQKYTAEKPVSVHIELIPVTFSITGLNINKLSITAPSGQIEKYVDGSLKGVEYLNQNVLDISNLIGSIQSNELELTIRGAVSSVKSDSFTW